MNRFVIEDKDFEFEYQRRGAYHLQQEGFQRWFLQHNYRLCARLLPQRGRLLDLGCGEAALADYLRGSGIEYCGLDMSPTAIELARRRYPSAQFEVGRMEDLSNVFAATEFHAVVCSLALQYVLPHDLPAVLAAVRGKLKRGGAFVFSYINSEHALHHRLVEKLAASGVSRPIASIDGLIEALAAAGLPVERLVGTNLPLDVARLPRLLHRVAFALAAFRGADRPRASYHVVFRSVAF